MWTDFLQNFKYLLAWKFTFKKIGFKATIHKLSNFNFFVYFVIQEEVKLNDLQQKIMNNNKKNWNKCDLFLYFSKLNWVDEMIVPVKQFFCVSAIEKKDTKVFVFDEQKRNVCKNNTRI